MLAVAATALPVALVYLAIVPAPGLLSAGAGQLDGSLHSERLSHLRAHPPPARRCRAPTEFVSHRRRQSLLCTYRTASVVMATP